MEGTGGCYRAKREGKRKGGRPAHTANIAVAGYGRREAAFDPTGREPGGKNRRSSLVTRIVVFQHSDLGRFGNSRNVRRNGEELLARDTEIETMTVHVYIGSVQSTGG